MGPIKIEKSLEHALHELIHLERNAQEFGFEWPDQMTIIEQAIDECKEIKEAINKNEGRDRIQEEIGDLLHAIVSLCEFEGFSIEEILLKTNLKFGKRMHAIKRIANEHGLVSLKGQSFGLMLELWRKAKNAT